MAEERADEAVRRLVPILEELLYRHDPVGIAFGDNEDEYAPEAAAIAPRLGSATRVEDVLRIMHEEFVRWFDSGIAGPASRYEAIADEVWTLLGFR